MRRIILLSTFRRSLPNYANEVIFMLHASAIVDLTGAARDIYSRYYTLLRIDDIGWLGNLSICL
jgi:arginine/ornithine transport system permease protein